MENLNQIFQRILGHTNAKSINGDNQYIGLCPAHDDDSPSFSIKMNDEKILMNCFAGCSFDQICSSLGIQKSETFNQSESTEKITHNEREIQTDTFIDLNKKVSFYSQKHKQKVFEKTRYPYRKSDGDIMYFVIRSEPKDFRCMNPMGELKIEGIERVPYRLPQMIQGIKDSKTILILEGEKDADRAAEMGFIATTFQGGAGKWKEEYLEHFVGAHVVLIPDNDEPGYEGMKSIAQKLIGTAIEVAILELPGLGERKEKHGKDFSDWADIDGNTSNALMDLIKKADLWVTPLDDWLEPTERGHRVNRALLAQHIANDEDGNLIYVNQTFWEYEKWALEKIRRWSYQITNPQVHF